MSIRIYVVSGWHTKSHTRRLVCMWTLTKRQMLGAIPKNTHQYTHTQTLYVLILPDFSNSLLYLKHFESRKTPLYIYLLDAGGALYMIGVGTAQGIVN